MSKQSLTTIRDYLAGDRRCHSLADIVRSTGISRETVSRACGVLTQYEPGVVRVQRGVWQYREPEPEPEPALAGPTGNGSADLAALRRAVPAQLTLAPEDGSLWPDGEPMRREPREPEPVGRLPFEPRYGPPFRVRIESQFRSRHGGNGYRIRTEDGRGGFLFWDDEAGE